VSGESMYRFMPSSHSKVCRIAYRISRMVEVMTGCNDSVVDSIFRKGLKLPLEYNRHVPNEMADPREVHDR
jgi:hypothetical protein